MSVSLYFDTLADSHADGYGSQTYLGFWDTIVDNVAPGAAVVSPAEHTSTGTNTAIVVDVTDSGSIAYVGVFLAVGGAKTAIYRKGAFETGYTSSTVAAITGGYRFTLRRDGGWPKGPLAITFDPVDSAGNVGA